MFRLNDVKRGILSNRLRSSRVPSTVRNIKYMSKNTYSIVDPNVAKKLSRCVKYLIQPVKVTARSVLHGFTPLISGGV